MQHLQIAKVILSWIKNYIVNFVIYMLVYITHIANDRTYKFEYEGDTYKINLNEQNLNTLMYLYHEELNVSDTEKFDDEHMELHRIRYLKNNKLKQLRITTSNDVITLHQTMP